MVEGLRVTWRGVRHLQQRGYQYIWANLLWIALSLPIVTAPAAYAGLARFSYYAHRQPTVSFDEFWQGFRENLRRGLFIGVLNVVIVVVNVGNLLAYQSGSGAGYAALRVVWLVALVGWFAVQLYVWPLLYAMEQPSLKGAYRNAGVMILLNPLFTIGVWLGCLIVLVVSVVFPVAWLLVTGSLFAAIGTSAVQNRLYRAGYEQSNAFVDAADVPLEEASYDTF